jgi:CheY-like chemotaxis protein
VLFVDDDATTREGYIAYLVSMGYDVMAAANGWDALTLASTWAPKVIVLDLGLPDIDGWEVARQLKATGATVAIPIIALTAHALASDRETSVKVGCSEFDTKPVELPRLLGKIEALLQRGRPS